MVKQVTLVDASYTPKQDKRYYGYKGHIAAEAATGMMHRAEYTSAKVYDSQVFKVFDDGRTPMSADKAYWSRSRHPKLGGRSLLQQGYQLLHPIARACNQVIARIRGRIEKTFAYFKRVLGSRRVRYRGVSRGLLELQLKSIC